VIGLGRVQVQKQAVEGNDPHGGHGWVCEGDRSNYCVLGGCLLSLSLCRRGFQDLLKVWSSSLLMLCGCISRSIASLMSRSMYAVLAERSFVSCSLIMWSWLMLCSATADFFRLCQSCMSIVLFELELDESTASSNINPAAFTWNAVYTWCS